MAADAVVDVVAVRNRLMTAAGAMDVIGIVTATAVIRGTAVRVVARDLDHVLVNVVLMGMVKMTIVQIVYVPSVAHRGMAAAWAVLVSMLGMF